MGSFAIKLAAALAAAALSITVAGCAGTSGSVASAPAQGSNADGGTTASSEAPADSASTPADDGTLAFGQSFKWDDGLQVTVSKPVSYKPSRWAAAKKSKHYLAMTVTVVNGTQDKFEPAAFYITGQSGDEEADQVFDSQKGVGNSPSTKLLPGRQAKWKVAFAVKDPNDFVLEVTPGFEYDSVLYQLG